MQTEKIKRKYENKGKIKESRVPTVKGIEKWDDQGIFECLNLAHLHFLWFAF